MPCQSLSWAKHLTYTSLFSSQNNPDDSRETEAREGPTHSFGVEPGGGQQKLVLPKASTSQPLEPGTVSPSKRDFADVIRP